MRRMIGSLTLALGTVAASLLVASPAHADDHSVRPGESIQAAIDAAAPGDTIKVRAGTFAENVNITKDGITLQGAGAGRTIIVPPAKFADSPCNQTNEAGEVVGGAGICVGNFTFGPPDAPPTVIDVVEHPRIKNLTVRGFGNGAFLLGTDGAEITRSEFVDNGEYGFFANNSTRGNYRDNVSRGSEVAGIYIGDSADAQTHVVRNAVYDNNLGIFIRDAANGEAGRNDVHNNCLGILLLDTGAPNAPTGWEIERNRVVDNNRVCPPAGPAPPQSGAGIVLAGASANTVAHNVVRNNVPAGPSPFAAGGIVLVPTVDFGGSVPTGNVIKRNLLEGNQPFDISDGGVDNTFSRNVCDTSQPATICS